MEVISAGLLKNRDLRKYKPEYGLRFLGSNSNSLEAKRISSLAQAPCPIAQGGWSNVGSITGLANSLVADGCPFEGAYKGDYISGYKMTEIIIERGGRILPEIDFGNFKGYWEYSDVVANINHRDDNTQDKPYFTFNCAIKSASSAPSNPVNATEAVRKSFVRLKDELIADGYKLQNPSSPTFYMCAKGGIRVKMELFLDEASPLDSHLKITEYNFKN